MTPGQELALSQLRQIAAAPNSPLEIIGTREAPADGLLHVYVSVSCESIPKKPGGMPLRDRERLNIAVPEDFPFQVPELFSAHERFAGFPHVYWSEYLCLYQTPETEWNPRDGMYGFATRMDQFLRRSAVAELDPVGAPLHPPTTHRSGKAGIPMVIPRVDTPRTDGRPWLGLAHLNMVSDQRIDLVGWSGIEEDNIPTNVAATVLLDQPLTHQFPTHVNDLMRGFEKRGVNRAVVLPLLQYALVYNAPNTPLLFVVGAPMRGIKGSGDLKYHLTVWFIEPKTADGIRLAVKRPDDPAELANARAALQSLLHAWLETTEVDWCPVREDRPEIVTRRDYKTPMAWFSGKSVAIWGCGAIGGRVAEVLARCNVARLILYDHSRVSPGVTARQPYDDADIGQSKARALASRLRRLAPKLDVESRFRNVLRDALEREDWYDGADLVIDATASQSVLLKLERVATVWDANVPVASLAIGPRAYRGMAVLRGREYRGGPFDVSRKAKLRLCAEGSGSEYLKDFFPSEPIAPFQPEPGCSDATFIGSQADVDILVSALLNRVADDLGASDPRMASAHFVRNLGRANVGGEPESLRYSLMRDLIGADSQTGFEVRIAPEAWHRVRGWIRTSARLVGPDSETGGLLFGEKDDVLKVIWVTEVSGPPPDSEASATEFVCGVRGMHALNQEKKNRTRGSVQYVGMWHTHPESEPLPSLVDLAGVRKLLRETGSGIGKALLMIMGRPHGQTSFGTYVFTSEEFSGGQFLYTRVCCIQRQEDESVPGRQAIGLALSGGGSRAIAFHLGCFRALHDLGILERVNVLSCVSGGSVIGAMYAYSDDAFEAFDARVVRLLRRGLATPALRKLIVPKRLIGILATDVLAGIPALGATILRKAASVAIGVFRKTRLEGLRWVERIQPPFRRWISRTDALRAAMEAELFGSRTLLGPRRNNLDIVLNSCELRTGSAFRFGTAGAGSWRYGRKVNADVPVAEAVAASAAYPALLPALDKEYDFVRPDGTKETERTILTDGGVFDNLGVTCLEPGRSVDYSTNVFELGYILSCDAGHGLFSDYGVPFWWPSRMVRSFDSVFRKVQDATRDRLHRHRQSGRLKGFALAYLGQRDERLPYQPADLIPREKVKDYPTDFSAMCRNDIDALALRGEQLTRLLVEYYLPALMS